jgi:hypothetical protein
MNCLIPNPSSAESSPDINVPSELCSNERVLGEIPNHEVSKDRDDSFSAPVSEN